MYLATKYALACFQKVKKLYLHDYHDGKIWKKEPNLYLTFESHISCLINGHKIEQIAMF